MTRNLQKRNIQKKNLRTYYLLTALSILVIVLVVVVLRLVIRDSDYSEVENRNLQTRPAFSLTQVTSGRYTSNYETYVEDQFPFRTVWIQVKSMADRLLGKTESNDIFLGKDGYLIENFTEPNPEAYETMIQVLDDYATSHGNLKQYMMIVPTAVSVYADKLPAFAVTGDENAYLDQLAADALNAGLTFIDVREAFQQAKENTQLYYRTDHHWTTDGAFTAYQCFLAATGLDAGDLVYNRMQVSNSFSGTLTASSGFRMGEKENIYVYLPDNSDVQYSVNYVEEAVTSASLYKTENLDVRDQYTVFMNGNHPLVKIETTAESKQVLLVLKDSYANCFIPFLTQHYKRILVVDPRYYYDNLEDLITSENVTDLLYLYNANSFASDTSLATVIGGDRLDNTPEESSDMK